MALAQAGLFFLLGPILSADPVSNPATTPPPGTFHLSDSAADRAKDQSSQKLDNNVALLPGYVYPGASSQAANPVPEKPVSASTEDGQFQGGNSGQQVNEWVDAGAIRNRSQQGKEGVTGQIITPAVCAVVALLAVVILCIIISRYKDDKRRLHAELERHRNPKARPVRKIRPYGPKLRRATGAPTVYRVPKA